MTAPAFAEKHFVVRTKLQPPQPHAHVLIRRRLTSLIQRALSDARLVLISAPAGAGKTTLLTTVLDKTNIQPIWISLDADDNDLARFLTLLVRSVAQAFRLPASAAQQALDASYGLAPVDLAQLGRHIVHALINDLPDPLPGPGLFVLDDLHVIDDPAIYAVIDELIARLPDGLALAIATRRAPPLALSRLRARRELCELRLDDLQFTVEEATVLLNERLGLNLPANAVIALHQRTEGWAAGLMLLAASLERVRTPIERTHFLERLVQSDSYLGEYLAEEVLNQQDPFIRMFLLETSILSDLTPAACQALTGRLDATEILDDLYRRNLFLVRLDDAHAASSALHSDGTGSEWEPTYRYHDLFRTFLQTRLRSKAPEWYSALHQRAARTEANPLRQMQHLLQAEDWTAAARLIEEHGETLVAQGQFATVDSWIAMLPSHVLENHIYLSYLRGIIAIEQRDLTRGRVLFEHILDRLAGADNTALEGATLAALASCCSIMADHEAGCRAAEEAWKLPIPQHLRVQLLTAEAHSLLGRGVWQQAAAKLEEVLTLLEEQCCPRALTVLVTYFFGIYGVLLPGSPTRLQRLCHLIDRSATPHHLLLRATAAQYQAWLLLWRNQWPEARTLMEQALQLSMEAGGFFRVEIEALTLLPVLAALEGDQKAAEAGFARLDQKLEQRAAASGIQPYLANYLFQLGRMYWLQGRIEAVQAVYERLVVADKPKEWRCSSGLPEHLRALLLLSSGETEAAIDAAQAALVVQERYRSTALGIQADARVLIAAALLKAGQVDAALAAIQPVLARHALEGTPGVLRWEGAPLIAPLLRLAIARDVYASFAAEVLASFGEAETTTGVVDGCYIPETGETLTAREVEVLRLLARGASNNEIAAQLIISPHTAKHHVSHVLQKLRVATRTAASLRARDLGLA